MFSPSPSRLLMIAAVVYAMVVMVVFPKFTIDDAYIYYRYAENLALHGELAWNIGEEPVEGYTGIALVLLLAFGIKLSVSPILMGHAVGVFSFLLGGVMLYLILRRIGVGDMARGVTLLLYATMPLLYTHTFSGLETMLFVSVILASLYALLVALAEKDQPERKERHALLLLLFLSLIRPEGVLFAGLSILALAYCRFRRGKQTGVIFFLQGMTFYVLPALVYMVWRLSYYGEFLPNTFYIKIISGWSLNNLADFGRFFRQYFTVPLVGAFFLVAPFGDTIWRKIRTKEWLPSHPQVWLITIVGSLFSAVLLLQFVRSHLTMNYAARFYMPFLPIVWIVLGVLFDLGWRALREVKLSEPWRYRLTLTVLGVLAIYQLALHGVKLEKEIRFAREEKISIEQQHVQAGKFLPEVVPATEWLVIYIDAGAIPYFSKLKTVDFGGLNDKKLAKEDLSLPERVDYFYSFKPAAAVFTSLKAEVLDYGEEAAAISADPRFGDYKLVKKYLSPLTPPEPYHEFVYLRRDLAASFGQ